MTDHRFIVDYAPHAEDFEAALQAGGLSFTPYTAFYDPRIRPDRRVNAGLALTDDPYTADWLRDYFTYQSRGTSRLGLVTAPGAWVTHEWGLAVAPKSGLAISGMHGFGWSDYHFDHMTEAGLIARTGDAAFTLAPLEGGLQRPVERLSGTAALVTFPGALTYGHWIVDVAGRLELLNALEDMNLIDHFLLPRAAGWMRPFLVAYGVLPDRIIEMDKTTVYETERLLIPTTLSHHPGGGLPIAFSRLVFRRLDALVRQWGKRKATEQPKPKPGGLVFLEHTRITSEPGREAANIGAVRDMILRMGGRVVNPMELSLSELAEALSGARLIVGEDSSALHNVIFAPASVLVLETSRRNMLHAAIQEACKRRIAFFAADKTGTGWQLDTVRLKAMIQSVLKR